MDKIEIKKFIVNDFQPSEAIKTLRTNLMFCGDEVRAIGLTSFGAGEGKSSIAFQLAASFAQSGKSVMLVDADLRKSVLQYRLGVRERTSGLSHYLSGMTDIKSAVKQTDIPGFYILFAGTRVANSAELLGGEKFKKLIPALKESFDYVIVDMPPVGVVIDSAAAAPALDGTVLIIDTTHSSYKLERRVKAQLERTGSKILGVVLNKVDFKEHSGYYGQSYYYGYGEKAKK